MQQFFKGFTGKPVGAYQSRQYIRNEIAPDVPFCAVGDIHGRADLLDQLLCKVAHAGNEPVVFLGDYIDRGPASAAVLDRLHALSTARPHGFICLMGNHERMMLDFIDDPLGKGLRWLRFGGLETLASFGIDTPCRPTPEQALDLSAVLENTLSPDMLHWLQNLRHSWKSGNMWCVHAGMDPLKPPSRQRSETLLWGHPAFLDMPRGDGVCVVHAHTPVSSPTNQDSRIAIDTDAYRTDRLTAAFVDRDSCCFVQT